MIVERAMFGENTLRADDFGACGACVLQLLADVLCAIDLESEDNCLHVLNNAITCR